MSASSLSPSKRRDRSQDAIRSAGIFGAVFFILAAMAGFMLLASSSSAKATIPLLPGSPSGPPAPSPTSSWTTVFADDFNVPLGTKKGQDNLWFPNEPWLRSPTTRIWAGSRIATNAYSSSQVSIRNGLLVETARFAPDVLPAASHRLQSNYLSGLVSSSEQFDRCSLTRRLNCYRSWTWDPAPGASWAFQIVCKFPRNTGELFNAFWTRSVPRWVNERDFFEGKSGGTSNSGSNLNETFFDTDWIFGTIPLKQNIYTALSQFALGFDPSTAMHTYTYVINPNQTWSLYVDGVLQKWVGTDGVAPWEQSVISPMQLVVNYALQATTFTTGTREFLIDSVQVFEDSTTASLPHHPYSSGVEIAPGTHIASNATSTIVTGY